MPDQVIYHLQQGGMDHSDPKLLWRAARYLIGALAVGALFLWFHFRLPTRWRRLLLAVLFAVSTWSLAITVDVRCTGQQGDYLAEHYVPPQNQILIPPKRRPDILIIFFESLESAQTDASVFGQNLVPRVSSWREENREYGQMHNMGGSSWTMGGMFSTLCGMPLQSVGFLAHNSFEFGHRFFSGGTCLTDMLARQGYEISFYGGGSLKFAGKGKFFEAHSVARRFGAEEWSVLGINVPNAAWGLSDVELMRQVRLDMMRPRNAEQPRLDIVLTINSHPPTGVDDPECRQDAGRLPDDREPGLKLRRAYQCTDRLVGQLIQEFASRVDGRDKVILVQGDHLGMRGDIDSQIAKYALNTPRTVFHALGRYDGQGLRLEPQTSISPSRQFTHVDLMPTLLAEAGFRWPHPEGRMALGTALVREPGGLPKPAGQGGFAATLAESEGFRQFDSRATCQSSLFKSLW